MKKILLIGSILASTILLSGCWETSNGEKVGTIVKFAKEGMFIKTWEGELIRGGLNNGGGSFGKSFHFTVEDRSMIEKITDALETQKTLKVKYHQEWTTLWRTETSDNTFVDSIEIIK
ncbi:MAG: hypothetical protein EPO02_13660 [Nitrospirae bacterium]|nr:MAG: hypothetical protein EPO02_13660 [Nitrospirota bacterium]